MSWGTSSSRTSRARLVPKTAGGKRPRHQDANCVSMVMKWTVAKTPMVWFRRCKGRVSIQKSMNGSFSIWDELKFSESLGCMCLSTNQHGSFGDDCQTSGIRHDVSQSQQKKNSAADHGGGKEPDVFSLRSLHSKSFRYCKSKYFSHFHSFFSSMVGPFSWIHSPRNWRPKKAGQIFPLDFNRGGTIPQQPSDASNHPRGVKNKMRSCDVKVFRVVFILFGCEDRTDEVV